MAYFTKRYHPPGTSPGTLTQHENVTNAPLKILLSDYTDPDYHEQVLTRPEECIPYLEKDTITWIHVQGDAEPATMRELGKIFGLHPLALEDVINSGQRPKIDEYQEHLFIVMSHPVIDADTQKISLDQVSLFIGKDYVISFHPGETDLFEPIRTRLRNHIGRIREKDADYLTYALIDMVIDEGYPVLEWLGDEIEQLEDELLEQPTQDSLRKLHQLKRTLIILRRMLWPQRDVLSRLVRSDNTRISENNRIYFNDCYDHTIQIMELNETYRDMVTGLMDIYLSSVSFRLNEIMRVLTVIATIFIPLTFIVGLYGMNFSNPESPWAMPELRWYYGYPIVLVVMLIVVAGMLYYFKKKNWF